MVETKYFVKYTCTGNTTKLIEDTIKLDSNHYVGIGVPSNTMDAPLHVVGNIKMVDGNQGNNKVLTSDANGLASWKTNLPTGTTLGQMLWWNTGTSSWIVSNPNELLWLDNLGSFGRMQFGTISSGTFTGNPQTVWMDAGGSGSQFYCLSMLRSWYGNGASNRSDIFAAWGSPYGLNLGSDSGSTQLTLKQGNVIISGNTTISGGTLTILDGTQGTGKVFTSDSNGLGSWQTPSTGSTISKYFNNSNVSGAITVDLSRGNTQSMILTGVGGISITFSNAVAGVVYNIIVTQDNSGGHTLSWTTTINWDSSATPSQTSTAKKTDMYQIIYDGSKYWGVRTIVNA